jgi:hypothetical protein
VRARRPSRSRRCPTRYQAYRSDFVYPEPVEQSVKTQTATTYTFTLTDNGKLVTLSNAAAITVTVPTDAAVAFPAGASIDLLQLRAGQITVLTVAVRWHGDVRASAVLAGRRRSRRDDRD